MFGHGDYDAADKCGGNEALEVYLSHPVVQEAIHVTASGVKKWGRHSRSWTYTRTCVRPQPPYRKCVIIASLILDFTLHVPDTYQY